MFLLTPQGYNPNSHNCNNFSKGLRLYPFFFIKSLTTSNSEALAESLAESQAKSQAEALAEAQPETIMFLFV